MEYTGHIAPEASELAKTGLRWVFAEGVNDRVGGAVMSPEEFAASDTPQFSAQMRGEGLQRIEDLYSAWHGKNDGRIQVFPAVVHTENASPELLRAIRAFAEKHDLGYTIHLNQTHAEVQYMMKYHDARPAEYLYQHGFLGPRLVAAHARYVDEKEIALLGQTKTKISHQATMAANRGVSPPIPALRVAGCPICLGTDNNNNDMFAVMKVAMLTERILSAWLHNGQPSDVESVMVDGEFIMRDHKILTVDEESIIAEASKVGKRVWDEVEKANPVVPPGRSGWG